MDVAPRYPADMKQTKKAEAFATYKSGNYEEAARLFTTAHLAGLFTHCVVLPAIPDNTHLCEMTTTWSSEIGYEFMWLTRIRKRDEGDDYDGREFQFQTGKCGEHQRFAFKIVAYGGVEDEGIDSF
jgi:hypothetical protein